MTFSWSDAADLTTAPHDSWDSIVGKLPAGWRPEFLVVYLPYQTVPDWVWSAPLPLVAFAPDANLQFHHYRRALARCELVLTDLPTLTALTREGLAHVRRANLFGLGRDFVTHPWAEVKKDLDVLFVGSLNGIIHRRRQRWLGRLARLAARWRIAIHSGVFGANYRVLLNRARITLNCSIRGEINQRVPEGVIAGTLLFQERDNREAPEILRDRQECVLYGEDDLEALLTYYLEHEDERRAIALRARQRVQEFTFETLWSQALQTVEAEWPGLVERAQQRRQLSPQEDLRGRTWQALGAVEFRDEQLFAVLEAALAQQPGNAALHNALGLIATRKAQGQGAVSSAHAVNALVHFRRAVDADPAHVLARLNLVEALVATQQRDEAIQQAQTALGLLERLPHPWPVGRPVPGWLDDGHFPPAYDQFRVEWERAAFDHAGRPLVEMNAKCDLLRWRLQALLASLTGNLHHHHEAVLARPDLPITRAALGSALLRSGQPVLAIPHLREAVEADPFPRGPAGALFEALGAADDGEGQRRLAREQRLLHKAAPGVVPAEPWFENVPPVGDELATIIVLCRDEVAYTRLCLESVLQHTRRPYELVLIDNASSDGTPGYLAEIGRHGGPERVSIVRNETNRGFAAGCNQGLALARGEYVVFLNNDTLVTETWLDGLIGWSLHDWPKVGMVGAVTNFSRPPQQIEVSYATPSLAELAERPEAFAEGLERFAAGRRREFAGKALEVDRLTGFCLLARREVLQQIGGFDERYATGFFEDDDLCVRVRKAGFHLLVAQQVFIHHFGSRTFAGQGIDCRSLLAENFARFKEKWGPEESNGYRFPDSAAPLLANGKRVSLCMIVKNEEANLPHSLQAAADLVDEIIVVDTGSTDRTKEIAAQFGARVFDFPWCDSFSAARNETLRHATGEWVFWLDADDRLDEENRVKLRTLFAELKPENVGYVMKCRCLPDPQTGMTTDVTHVRLFRNLPAIRWEHRVHEQILPGVRRQGGSFRHVDIVIQHAGYQDRELRRRKLERDLRLLQLELAEMPNHPFTLFNLGSIYQELGRHAEALAALRRSLEGSHPSDSIVRKLYALIAYSHRQLGQLSEALETCREGREYYPDDEELLYQEAQLREQRQDLHGALACLLRLLQTEEAPHFSSVGGGMRGYRGRYLLAEVYRKLGRPAEAEAQYRLSLEEQSGYHPAWLGLAELFISQARWDELSRLAATLEGEVRTQLNGAVLRARGHLGRQEFAEARAILEELTRREPQALSPWIFLSHVLLKSRDLHAAKPVLLKLLELAPDDKEARQNLEVLLRELGEGKT